MCLILFAYKTHPKYKLVIAANRDEFYRRPTAPAVFWEEDPQVLAGRDLQAGGTWMGINTSGKISLLTNYRDMSNIKPDAPSRGHLVSDFLKNKEGAAKYLAHLSSTAHRYNGFNIICGNAEELYYYSNYSESVHQIKAGFHGLSNALMNIKWPKITKGIEKLKSILQDNQPDPLHILEALYDDITAPNALLPDTGVGLQFEKMLSPMFIKSEDYGSRSSTVLLIDYKGHAQYLERTYNVEDFSYEDRRFKLYLPST